VRVRYAETDQMGVVYYANYFVWFEVGRTDLLRAAGWTYRAMETDGFSLPVIEAHCDFRQSARYDDEVDVRTAGVLLTPVRIRFDYEVVRCADLMELARGYTVHASLSSGGRPCRLPQRVRDILGTSETVLSDGREARHDVHQSRVPDPQANRR
jgi:acyl-CoA thioester hydrolase